MGITTLQVDTETLKELKKAKDSSRQTYSELIRKLIRVYKTAKKQNQYDEFLHKIQQQKMKELWNNKEDEDWENV